MKYRPARRTRVRITFKLEDIRSDIGYEIPEDDKDNNLAHKILEKYMPYSDELAIEFDFSNGTATLVEK